MQYYNDFQTTGTSFKYKSDVQACSPNRIVYKTIQEIQSLLKSVYCLFERLFRFRCVQVQFYPVRRYATMVKDSTTRIFKYILQSYFNFCETINQPPMLDSSVSAYLKIHETKSKSYKRSITYVLGLYLKKSPKVPARQYTNTDLLSEEISISKYNSLLASMLCDPKCNECILYLKFLIHSDIKPYAALKITPQIAKALLEVLPDCPLKTFIVTELLPRIENMQDTELIFKKSYRVYLCCFQKHSGKYFRKCGFIPFIKIVKQLIATQTGNCL